MRSLTFESLHDVFGTFIYTSISKATKRNTVPVFLEHWLSNLACFRIIRELVKKQEKPRILHHEFLMQLDG